MRPWTAELRGRFDQRTITSAALRGNRLGDPAERPLPVYLPPGYDDEPERRYPTIYLIQGFTGQVDMWWNRSALRPTTPERIDELFASGTCPPALVVMVDAWTSLGGSQFLNSPATGRYLDYLCDDVVPYVDRHYRTLPQRHHRAITGKSSGGYGAMVVPMLRPDVFGALATHCGDALFEACYLREFPIVARVLRDRYGGSYDNFWADFRSRVPFTVEHDGELVDVWAMAACYSAEPDGSVTLPFDPATGRLRDEVWRRWLERDPVRMAAPCSEALRSMRAIYIDAGTRDEYYLDLGARAFATELDQLGIEYRFELFEGTHMAIEYRYPRALAYLAERISPAPPSPGDPPAAG